MDRLDYYDLKPKGMEAYLSHYGYHISKPMYEWAVGMMKDRNGNPISSTNKDEVQHYLDSFGIKVENNKAYDLPYVWCMAKADYWGSSIEDDLHLCRFVKDYLDDKDGSKTRAFDELYAKTVALGIPIDWEDVI